MYQRIFCKSRRSLVLRNVLSISVLCVMLGGCASLGDTTMPSLYSEPVVNNTYDVPTSGNDIIGHNIVVKARSGDSLDSIGHRYDVGGRELNYANPRLRKRITLRRGTKVIIPSEYILPPKKYRHGVVINVAELRLYYFVGNMVMTFPVALGREGWRTPLGKTYVFRKEESPTWNVPQSIRDDYLEKNGEELPAKVPPGEDNPLGAYAIYLAMNGYLIHGTNNKASIGRLVSSGCIRMYNKDVEQLYEYVSRGTPVNIIYFPNKIGWKDGKQLYLESHASISNKEVIYDRSLQITKENIMQIVANDHANVNWSTISRVLRNSSGIPNRIGSKS